MYSTVQCGICLLVYLKAFGGQMNAVCVQDKHHLHLRVVDTTWGCDSAE
jgi:hypothetical protein